MRLRTGVEEDDSVLEGAVDDDGEGGGRRERSQYVAAPFHSHIVERAADF